MNDKLAHYYHEELAYLRRQGSHFAKAHPKTARQLHLAPGMAQDPFVDRLLSSFAFLTARLRTKLDDEKQTLHRTLLDLLYPHYQLPLPSMTTIAFSPKDRLEGRHSLAKGTVIEAKTVDNKLCKFTTGYSVDLWPIELTTCDYKRHFHVKSQFPQRQLKSCLSFTLKTLKPSLTFSTLQLDKLRLHYCFDEIYHAYLLHQQLFNHLKTVVITYQDEQMQTQSLELPSDVVQGVGFAADEHILSYPANSFSGFCLLTEFFSYPQKFFYFDLCCLDQYLTERVGNEITVHCLFDQTCMDIENILDNSHLKLGCTPLINLFPATSEPIILDHHHVDYHLIPDDRRSMEEIEVYRVCSMSVTAGQQMKIACLPYYGEKYDDKTDSHTLYWQAIKRPCQELGQHKIAGSECFISFTLPDDQAMLQQHATVNAEVLCSNRELPMKIITDNDQQAFGFYQASEELVDTISSVYGFTSPCYRTLDEEYLRHTISHLHLNHLSFEEEETALQALKNSLALYHYQQAEESQWIEQGLTSVKIKRVIKRHPDNLKQGFCQGIEFYLEINESIFPKHILLLFGEVLHHYLTRSCTVNTFICLIITSQQRGEIHRWPALLGSKIRL